jgi:hypothetical protein
MIKLTDILNEKEDKDFGAVAFGDSDQDKGFPAFLRMQGKSVKDEEENTTIERKILNALIDWADGSADYIANSLTKFLPQIKTAKKRFPEIFAPSQSNGTEVYRGLDQISKKLIKSLVEKTKYEDWKRKGEYMICTKPIKYSPHRDWQSWSYSKSIAKNFGSDATLVTKQDNNFYFSNKTMRIVFGDNEREVLHNGKTFSNPVYIMMHFYRFEDYLSEPLMKKSKKNKR